MRRHVCPPSENHMGTGGLAGQLALRPACSSSRPLTVGSFLSSALSCVSPVTSSEALCKSSDEKLLNSSDTTACVFITLVKTRWRWWRTWGGVPACCLFSNPGCPVLLYTWSLPGCVGPAKAAHGSESAIGTDLGLLTFTF